MNFLAPFAFWFAAALPVIVLFYLLKRRRVVRLVPSTLLWDRFLAETQASAPFQKLRRNWLLFLQLLVLALVILALARPYFFAAHRYRALRVIILDASASMQSKDEAPNRFAAAKSQINRWIDSMREGEQAVLLLAAAHTEVKQSPTADKAALRRAVAECGVTDTGAQLTEALKLADTLLRDRPDTEIHLFSDGSIADIEEMQNRDLPLVYHQVGKRGNNTGIVAFEVRPHPEDPSRRAALVTLSNFSDSPRPVELQLLLNDRVVERQQVEVPSGGSLPHVFQFRQGEDGLVSVRFETEDDLAIDNEVRMISRAPQPMDVLLVTRGNRFLEKALLAAPRVQLRVAQEYRETPELDVVVWDGIAPSPWPQKNTMIFHAPGPPDLIMQGEVEAPPIVDWKTAHPILRFVQFDNVHIAKSLKVTAPSWAIPLVEAPQTPLVLAGERRGYRMVWIGFDVLESTWPLRVSFPVFVANAMEWLNPAMVEANLAVQTGQPFRYPAPGGGREAALTMPGGQTRSLVVAGDEVMVADTYRQGIYRLQLGTNEVIFCANILSAVESDTRPRAELSLGKHEKVAATLMRPGQREIWRWLAALGLGVLLWEWWYYHRRTV